MATIQLEKISDNKVRVTLAMPDTPVEALNNGHLSRSDGTTGAIIKMFDLGTTFPLVYEDDGSNLNGDPVDLTGKNLEYSFNEWLAWGEMEKQWQTAIATINMSTGLVKINTKKGKK